MLHSVRKKKYGNCVAGREGMKKDYRKNIHGEQRNKDKILLK